MKTKLYYLLIGISILTITGCGLTTNNSGATTKQANANYFNYKKADDDYQRLVLALKNGNQSNSTFDSIVRVYPLTTDYDPYDGVEQAQRLYANNAMDAQQWDRCLNAVNAILNNNYTSLTGHYGAMVCHLEAGNQQTGLFHKALLDGFMDAIWRSGSGDTPQNAFYITSSNDLYAFIQLQNYVATGQSLLFQDEKPIHSMTVVNQKNKKESIWYFDMTAQFRRGMFQ